MFFKQVLEFFKVCFCSGFVCNGMACHWDRHYVASAVDGRVNFFQGLRGAVRFVSCSPNAVLVCEEGLADWIGVGDDAVVDEGDFADAPAEEGACDVAAESPGAEEQAFSVFDLLEVEVRGNAPFHEFVVEIDLGFG